MKFFEIFTILVMSGEAFAISLERECVMPENIATSRLNRLRHACESNQNQFFAIETHGDFYCVFYSTFGIVLFGFETKFEIKVDGILDYEQRGADDFAVVNNTMIFGASIRDVIIIIKKKDETLPRISSVMITDGALPGESEKQEYCQCDCGRQTEAVPIILGGVEAKEGSWPWNAAIYRRVNVSSLQFRCGSKIINKRTLITTATCLFTQNQVFQPKKLLIATKELTLYGPSSKKLTIKKIITHENFRIDDSDEGGGNKLKHDYNVGLLITETEISFSLHLNAICLPDSDKFNFKGRKGMVVGWGFDRNQQLSQTLQQLELPLFPFLDCFYRNRDFFFGFSSKRNFCGGFSKDKGICSGDSGGGLYIENSRKRYTLFGLSSFSNCKCVQETRTCEIFDEGIFVNLAAYIQWIHNNMY